MPIHQQLEGLLESSGWRVDSKSSRGGKDIGFDFVASRGDLRYAVEIKVANQARRALLEGLLASAILRARAGAAAVDAMPLAVVCAPSISDPLLEELGWFVQRFGQGTAWGAMDQSGLAIFHGRGLEGIKKRRHLVRKPPAPQRSDFLSDLGQWMLKVLLRHQLPELRMNAAPEDVWLDEPIAGATSLARTAGVAVPTAFRFVASLKKERFLLDEGAFQLVRVDNLLDHWRAALKRRPSELRARWLFPSKDAEKQLDHALRKHPQRPGERACLGLFAACDRLGFRFVTGVAPHLYLEKISVDALQRLGLRSAEPGENADVLVREPRFPESVFRGALERAGVPVADVLQCWLDVADNPARGEEMAAHLFERVIRPRLLEYEP